MAYRGLSKKELDVKLSSGKGTGKSDGVRREEVFAFLSGEKHKIGFLGNQGVIGSEAVRKVPDEALEQLEQEEAELGAWMQAAQRRASVESSGKPDSDNGAGSSRRRSTMRRCQKLPMNLRRREVGKKKPLVKV